MDDRRKALIARRQSVENRLEKQEALVAKLMPFLKPFSRVALYFPIQGEADILSVRPDGLLPLIRDDELLFGSSQIVKKGTFGIYEPLTPSTPDPDCLVVPMVAFWQTQRMGYGRGYYDRFLQRHPDLFTIGVAFDEQEHEFEKNPWDVSLDMLITPTRILVNRNLYERKRKYTELLETV